jgi:predicted GNAT superfamily acetyltransferase
MMLEPKIRLLSRHDEYRECERLQEAVWGGLSVSSEVMVVTQKYGGVVLGAWLGKKMAGFIYAFLGRRGRMLIHWSHMMAVAPAYRDRGLGFKMKLAHRRLALDRGIRSIGWTFDPLQSRNAALNIRRLGARVEDYVVDCYGHFPSIIERGLPSDRFLVSWPIASAAVIKRLREGPPARQVLPPACINKTALNSCGLLENGPIHYTLTAPHLLLEIPLHTDIMREQNLALARGWRLKTRRIFQHYFSAGYRVKDFIPPGGTSNGRCFYVLERRG